MATAVASPFVAPALPFSSAAGLLALLEEEDETLRVHALTKLYEIVDQYWAEVSTSVPLIEQLSEMETFPARELAAAVASKVFFHLEVYNDALRLALGAGQYFDVSAKTEYVSTLVSRCIDEYVALRTAGESSATSTAEAPVIDPRMEAIVERMFARCYADGEFSQAMGIALESHRLDKVEEAIRQCPDQPALLAYTTGVCQVLVRSRATRLRVLRVLVKLHREQEQPDHVAVCRCLQLLGEARLVAEILKGLVASSGTGAAAMDDAAQAGTRASELLAYQIAFDVGDSENLHFILEVAKHLPQKVAPAAADPAANGDAGPAAGAADGAAAEVSAPATHPEPAPDNMDVQEDGPAAELEAHDDAFWARVERLRLILVGGFAVDLALTFLYKKSDTDLLILKNVKTAIENRNPVLHNATVVAHGYMTAGTTIDTFLRENLEWMGRASNWAKLTATASIGVVHRGHTRESMTLLQPYLPQGGVSASPYSEGGALYALGLIHVGKGSEGNAEVLQYLGNALRNAGTNEMVQHGACLGLGLAGMGTASDTLYEDLKNTLYTDSAVAGEAAAIGIGLLMLGASDSTASSKLAVTEMVAYAHDTAHEKIIRGLALGVALCQYGLEEAADAVIEQLSRDRDPLLRYGAMYCVGLAYCGTGNNAAVRRLLHVAVSDVNDSVRMAAVTCLGFVLFRSPEQVPRLVSLLAESFNAHVRYGACLAIGMSCAGTGSKEALEVVEPMMDDGTDFVRQGALIAVAMVYMQHAEARAPKVKAFRQRLLTIIGDKHQTTMTKVGAILATGILDAGGRNVTISMQSRAGFTRMPAVVGLAVWCQYWYWYPLMHFMSLAFTPTMLVGLNADLKLPKSFEVKCNAKASQFAYPKRLEEKKEEKKERVTTVTLSTTAKAKAREARKELERKKEEGASDEVADATASSKAAAADDNNSLKAPAKDSGTGGASGMEVDGVAEVKGGADAAVLDAEGKGETGDEGMGSTEAKAAGEPEEEKKKKEPEPTSFMMGNPARVTPVQEAHVHFEMGQRYVPVRQTGKPVGIIMLLDQTPEVPEDATAVETPGVSGADEEAEPPEPFEWNPDDPYVT